jgi:putative membrane protein
MSERSFYEERAKREARAAVVEIEAQTSAEIVVCLRHVSGVYRDADYLFGFLVSLGALVTMLFVDHPFVLGSFPVGAVAGFVFGTIASAHIDPIRRILVFPARRLAAVRTAARAVFVELGVSRTHGRSGVLLYVSVFERRVEVVPDVGIDPRALGPDWKTAVAALEQSLTPSPDVDRFLGAMRALGPVLGRALPRAADDVNELPDEVQ